jgi:hypothetical protein
MIAQYKANETKIAEEYKEHKNIVQPFFSKKKENILQKKKKNLLVNKN